MRPSQALVVPAKAGTRTLAAGGRRSACALRRSRRGGAVWPLRAWLGLAFAAVLAIAASGAARAHAVLLGSDPPHGAALAQAPHHLVLRFNEPVTPLLVRLLDAAGRERALPRPAHAIDRDVHAPLPPDLGPGTYVASYRVVSADGHPIAGAIVFAIGGAPDDAPAAANDASPAWRLAAIVNRAVHLVCLFLAAGGLLFAAIVARGAPPSARRTAFAAVAAATGLLGIALHGAAVAGGLDAASAAFWRAALATPQATSALASLGGLALAFVAAPRIGGAAGAALAAGGALFALAAAGATGHSAAAGWPWWLVGALHVAMAGFWLGSLPPLWRALRAAPEETVAALRRFSQIAVPAVIVLALAGTGLALQRMGGPGDLVATDYGRLVVAKLVGAALLVAIAARNKLVLTPALARCGGAQRLRSAIALEAVLMSSVVALAAVLAHSDPHAGHAHHDHRHGAASAGAALRLEAGERVAAVEIYPARAGRNALTVSFAKRSGEALAPLEATLELALPGAGIEGLTVRLTPLAPGRFAADLAEIALPGRWHMRIDALISDFEKVIFRGEVDIR